MAHIRNKGYTDVRECLETGISESLHCGGEVISTVVSEQ